MSTPAKGSSAALPTVFLVFMRPVVVYVSLHPGLQAQAGGWFPLGLPQLTKRDLI